MKLATRSAIVPFSANLVLIQSTSSGREDATTRGRTTVVAVTTSGNANEETCGLSRTAVSAEVSALSA
jgi:hypothetical protein